jgi:hypothetical protein
MKHTLGNSRPHLAHKLLRDDLYGEICGTHEVEAGHFVDTPNLRDSLLPPPCSRMAAWCLCCHESFVIVRIDGRRRLLS